MCNSNRAILNWTVNKLRKDRYPKLSSWKLLCEPTAAHDVCISVRQALPFAWNYSDARILRAYVALSIRESA